MTCSYRVPIRLSFLDLFLDPNMYEFLLMVKLNLLEMLIHPKILIYYLIDMSELVFWIY